MEQNNQSFSLSSTTLIIFAGPLDPPLDQPEEPPPLLGQPEEDPPLCQPLESTHPADAKHTITPRTTNTCKNNAQIHKWFSLHP